MQYRDLGNTGMHSSVIGLGAEHLDNTSFENVRDTIYAAQDGGVNIMDVFMPGRQVRENIGKALHGHRKDWIIQGHIGSVDTRQQYDISRDLALSSQYFDDLLTYLNTDYIDVGMLFFMDDAAAYDAIFANGIVEYARDLKKKGIIRAIGASAHSPAIARRLVEEGVIEVLLFSINPAFDMAPKGSDVLGGLQADFSSQQLMDIDPERADLYRLCANKGVGITVMKSLGAGKLLSREHTPFKEPLSVAQCIHYALDRPAVASVMVGANSPEQERAALSYLDTAEEARDYSAIIHSAKEDFTGNCVYCNHCRPCPVSIDIASVQRYYDIAALDEKNIPPSIRQHYKALAVHADACIECGNCEKRCPFSVPIMQRMKAAARVFG